MDCRDDVKHNESNSSISETEQEDRMQVPVAASDVTLQINQSLYGERVGRRMRKSKVWKSMHCIIYFEKVL